MTVIPIDEQRMAREPVPERLFVLDALKAACIAVVVFQHASLLPESAYREYGWLLTGLFAPLRLCVPVLLAISFFLLERSLQKKTASVVLGERLWRLAIPTVFWFGLAAALQWRTYSPGEIFQEILRGEIFVGAYYLVILLLLTPLYVLVCGRAAPSTRAWVALAAQIAIFVGIDLLLVYGNQPLLEGIRQFDRSRPLYWIGYAALGTLLYRNFAMVDALAIRLSSGTKAVLLAGAVLAVVLESCWQTLITGGVVRPFNYALVSCLLAVPVVFLCCVRLRTGSLPGGVRQAISLLSTYSLGIFCINGILAPIMTRAAGRLLGVSTFNFAEVLLLKGAGWLALLVVSLLGAMLLDRVGFKSCVR